MKLIIFFLMLFLSCNLNAQLIKFRVIDSKTGAGIPYVNAMFQESLHGTIADSSGIISLNNDQKRNNLLITCIGYRDTMVAIDNLQAEVIKLIPKEYVIPEVTVIGNEAKEMLIGCQKKNPEGMIFTVKKSAGYFFYFNRSAGDKIKSVGINLALTKNSAVQLFVRILEPDTTCKTIGRDLLPTYKKVTDIQTGWNDIDLKNENIRFSKNGIVILMYLKFLEGSSEVKINCSHNEPDYTWMSSTNFRKDYSMNFGKRSFLPAIRMRIVE